MLRYLLCIIKFALDSTNYILMYCIAEPQGHVEGKAHTKALLQWERQSTTDATIGEAITEIQKKMDMKGSLLHVDVKLFRLKAVQLMYKANISVNSLTSVAEQLESWAGVCMGGRRALDNFAEILSVVWNAHIKTSLSKLCFPQFSTMTDGTPCFPAAEGMKLRVVTYDWTIKEPLVSIKLLKKSPNAMELAHSFTNILQNDLGLDISNWRAASKDRHATNQAAINLISANTAVIPFPSDCNAHTVSHVPEKFIMAELDTILKCWRKGLGNGGNLPLLFHEVFRERPRKGTGVRFYIQWEQCMQLQKIGLENVLRLVVDVCVERKYAAKSMMKMQTRARDAMTLGKALVQLAAVSTAGLPFCKATYNLEGDGFLAPIAHSILHGLHVDIERGIPMDGLEAAATRAAELVKPSFDIARQRVHTLEVD